MIKRYDIRPRRRRATGNGGASDVQSAEGETDTESSGEPASIGQLPGTLGKK